MKRRVERKDEKMISRRELFNSCGAFVAASLANRSVFAQASRRPVRLVVGFPAGGASDYVARILAEHLRTELGVPIIVENKVGAGGRIAAEFVRSSTPDGSTLLFGPHLLFTIYPYVYRQLTYELARDFAPVAGVMSTAYSISISSDVPTEVRTLPQYISWVRADPKRAVFGHPAAGGTPHFLGIMFARAIGVTMTPVPYKGGAPLLQDLLGGQVPMAFQVVSDAAPNVKSGKLRSLAISAAGRSPFLPEVPTLAESGYAGLVAEDRTSLFAPAKTPRDVLDNLEKVVANIIARDTFRKSLGSSYLEPAALSAKALGADLQSDFQRWGPVIQASGFKAED
jgi:tripartite-type tricarboxylate transporter receptor subunit TctC